MGFGGELYFCNQWIRKKLVEVVSEVEAGDLWVDVCIIFWGKILPVSHGDCGRSVVGIGMCLKRLASGHNCPGSLE